LASIILKKTIFISAQIQEANFGPILKRVLAELKKLTFGKL